MNENEYKQLVLGIKSFFYLLSLIGLLSLFFPFFIWCFTLAFSSCLGWSASVHQRMKWSEEKRNSWTTVLYVDMKLPGK